mmetsp:Transcript_19103/g.33005  ORF Transcript_19103/g.33005 Transcript_19103/m.33005 type:complete len:203 (+) Transcript_19103:1719-2327(+)
MQHLLAGHYSSVRTHYPWDKIQTCNAKATQGCVQPHRHLPQGVRGTQQGHHCAHNSWRRESPCEGHQRPTSCSNESHTPNAKRSENRGARNLLAVTVELLVELSSCLGFLGLFCLFIFQILTQTTGCQRSWFSVPVCALQLAEFCRGDVQCVTHSACNDAGSRIIHIIRLTAQDKVKELVHVRTQRRFKVDVCRLSFVQNRA